MSDARFYKEITFLFESYLSPKKNTLQLRVRNKEKNKILCESEINYSKILFDSELNIYKFNKQGKVVAVDNDNFEAVVMKKE